MTEQNAHSILVLGIGSRDRGDDGAGPETIARLRERPLPKNVRLQELWGDGTEIMQAWQGFQRVIVIDASCSSAAAGSIKRIDANARELANDVFHASTHQFGLAQAVEMARSLKELPSGLMLYALEGRQFGYRDELSREIQHAVSQVADEIAANLSNQG